MMQSTVLARRYPKEQLHLPKNVFEIDNASIKLDEGKSDLFHTIVMKLLYISMRGSPDIQLAVAFLCTRVSWSTHQHWSKLQCVM